MSNYKNFGDTFYLDKNIAQNDMEGLRDQLCVKCRLDRSFSTHGFEDGIEYVEKERGVKNLWQPLDRSLAMFGERVERQDPTLSDEDYSRAVFDLSINFCPERIEDVKKLGRYLEKQNAVHNTVQAPRQPQPQYRQQQPQSHQPQAKQAAPQEKITTNPPRPAAAPKKTAKQLLPVILPIIVVVALVTVVCLAMKKK